MIASTLICLAYLAFAAHAGPLVARAPAYDDGKLKQIRDHFQGIHWDDANNECSVGEMDIMVEATRVAMQMTTHKMGSGDFYDKRAAWNRYFVTDQTIADKNKGQNPPSKGDWKWSEGNRYMKKSIMSVIENLSWFAISGKPNRNGETPRARRIAYYCKEQNDNQKCKNQGTKAYTLDSDHMGGEGWAVFFCPQFFESNKKIRYIGDIVKGPKLGPSSMPTFHTFEGIVIHEWTHNNIATGRGKGNQIDDIKANLPGDPVGEVEKTYGDGRSHEFAWRYIDQNRDYNEINAMTSQNADNYALFYVYDWLADIWGWKDDGSGFYKRDLLSRDNGPSEDDQIDPDSDYVVSEKDIDISKLPDPVNCVNVAEKDADPIWKCVYMGEDLETWKQDVTQPFTSDGGCELNAKCHMPSGFSIDPGCKCRCDNQDTAIDDPRCKGFAGSLPEAPNEKQHGAEH